MIYFLNEDGNKELKHRIFPLGKGIRKHLQSTLDTYTGDKTIDGYKRLNNLLQMSDGIKYNEMKRLKNFFDNYSGTPNSSEFILNGGEPMKMWITNTLNSATKAIEDFKQAKKDAGIDNAFIQKHDKNRQPKKKNTPTQVKFKTNNLNQKISNNSNLKYENILHESSMIEFQEDYTPYYVITEFLDNPNGKQNWSPLINPSMYQKALTEFTTFGKFTKFPTKYIYQWMGIIMKNTAILESNTALAGHTQWFPYEDVEDAIGEMLIERYGEDYERDYETFSEILDDIGLYDWMQMPDGSDAWSDYGLGPLYKIIQNYNDNMEPEEVIVLVNKALDVAHCRGDLASIFIQGGSKTLSQISNDGYVNDNKQRKIICITESQANILKNISEAADDNFSLQELSNIGSFK